MDHDGNNNLASARFDIMNGPLIPTQLINTLMPSIPEISNNVLNDSAETAINECVNSNDHKESCNDVAKSNADFVLSIDDLYFFFDSTEKNDDVAQSALATHDRVKDKATHLTPEEIACRTSSSTCATMLQTPTLISTSTLMICLFLDSTKKMMLLRNLLSQHLIALKTKLLICHVKKLCAGCLVHPTRR